MKRGRKKENESHQHNSMFA